MDGVQPEKGNETLYVVREVFSGVILAAKNLKSGSASELMALLQPVKDMNFPVIGLVSDAAVHSNGYGSHVAELTLPILPISLP
jgi:hypothetical protein